MTRSRRDTLRWILPMAAAALMLGCSSGPKLPKPVKPVQLDITLTAAADLNPDGRNRPSPAVVRIYELQATAGFDAADFFSLFDKDRETLGVDMNTRDEFVLQPGQTLTIKREAKSDTRHVAVLVAYRDLERARWRAATPVAAPLTMTQTQVIRIQAGARAVEVTGQLIQVPEKDK